MSTLVFGFIPENPEECELPTFAVSDKREFDRYNCLSDNYPNEVHRQFREWEQLGIYEVMESIFEYPIGMRDVVKNYLEHFYQMEHNTDFEAFLFETRDEE